MFIRPLSFLAALLSLAAVASLRAQDIPVWQDVTPDYIHDQGINVTMYGVDFGNGTFVALGNKSGSDISPTNRAVVFTSPDGLAWTQQTVTFDDKNIAPGAGRVRFINDRFYFSTQDNPGSLLYSSPDGVTWTKAANLGEGGNGFTDFAFGNDTYVLARPTGSVMRPLPLHSGDLVKWTPSELAGVSGIANFNAVAFGAGHFVIVGQSLGGVQLFTSTTGIVWESSDGLSKPGGYLWLTHGNDVFLVNDKVSADGLTWTSPDPGLPPAATGQGIPVPRTMRYARFLNGQFVASSSFARVSSVFTSPDGQNWTETAQLEGGITEVNDFAYGNGNYVALASNNLLVSVEAPVEPPPPPRMADLSATVDSAKTKLKQQGAKTLFAGKLTVTNGGDKPAKNVQVAIYLSDTKQGNANTDRLLGVVSLADAGFKKVPKNNKSVGPVPFRFKAPTDEIGEVGGKYLRAVIDPAQVIDETDETNNAAVFGPLP